MMNKIYWKELIIMLKNGKEISDYEIDFRDEMVDFKDVALLNRNGIRVPENLIQYNDDDIDFSDDPEITDEDINKINLSYRFAETIPINAEIKEWLKTERIDINTLAAQLIRNFYETMKNLQKNATNEKGNDNKTHHRF